MSVAARLRRYRQRQRKGLAVWSVEVNDFGLFEALIAAGMVDPDKASPANYAQAAGRVPSAK